jgi:oligoendopeptidase F
MRRILLVAALAVAFPVVSVHAAEDAAIDPAYTWDLTELYPTVEAWNQAREEGTPRYVGRQR